jgi:integrase
MSVDCIRFGRADHRAMLDSIMNRLPNHIGSGYRDKRMIHCLRHTSGTRLGEAGAAAYTIIRLTGHSTVTVSQRYAYPTPWNELSSAWKLSMHKLGPNYPEFPGIGSR